MDRSMPIPDFQATIQAQKVTGNFVPDVGQCFLTKSYSPRNGTTTQSRTLYDENVTKFICQEIQIEARRAVESLGSRFATVELVTTDPHVFFETERRSDHRDSYDAGPP
jgi:hypothetical protein